MSNQRGYSPIFIIAGLVILLAIIGGVYYQKLSNNSKLSDKVNQSQSKSIPVSIPTPNWKIYKNESLGFSINYPEELKYVKEDEMEVSFANLDEETIKSFSTSPPNVPSDQLHKNNYFIFRISIDYNPTYQLTDGGKRFPVTEDTLIRKLGTVDKKPIETTIQGRKTVGIDSTMVVGAADQIGGNVDYYIFDNGRVIHLSATSHNLNEFTLSEVHQIFSSFTFLN